MRGYWNNDVDTTASFRSGFFHTGDIGYQDAEGSALQDVPDPKMGVA